MENVRILNNIWLKVVRYVLIYVKFSIGLRNGMAPIWRQAISWSNDDKKTYVAWSQRERI